MAQKIGTSLILALTGEKGVQGGGEEDKEEEEEAEEEKQEGGRRV